MMHILSAFMFTSAHRVNDFRGLEDPRSSCLGPVSSTHHHLAWFKFYYFLLKLDTICKAGVFTVIDEDAEQNSPQHWSQLPSHNIVQALHWFDIKDSRKAALICGYSSSLGLL